MNRREILQSGIAASALPVVGGAVWPEAEAPGVSSAQHLPIYKVVVDQRVVEEIELGRELSRLGFAVHAIDGDVTSLWYDDLFPRWRENPVAIAGVTAHGPLFCLERLSWDFGMRVVMRADHRRLAAGTFGRALSGRVSLQQVAAGARLDDIEPGTPISWVIAPVTRPMRA
jgi:hypothetical protein